METFTAKMDINGETVITTEYLTYSMVNEIIYTIFCIIAICTDFIIIHILFRFRRLRTIPYIFLTNWIIADACLLFFVILYTVIIVIMSITDSISLSINYTCVHMEMEVALYFAAIYFVILITIDWLIAAYFQRYIEIFRNYYKFIIGFIWIFSLLFWGVFTGLCFKSKSIDPAIGYNIFVICITSIFIIAIQTYTVIQKYKGVPTNYSTIMLTLTSIFVLSRLPEVILYMLYFNAVLEMLFMYIMPLHSILNLFLLYWLNEDFQACLRQFWKRSDQMYMEGANAFENHDEHEDQQFPVRISINNSNEELAPNVL